MKNAVLRPLNLLMEKTSCHRRGVWYCAGPFRPVPGGFNGLNWTGPGGTGGQNNIKLNPVFRGMVRQRNGRTLNQRKNSD